MNKLESLFVLSSLTRGTVSATRAGIYHRSVALLLILLGALAAPGQSTPFAPKHVAKLRMVTSSEISPDGQWIAYTVAVPRAPLKDPDGAAWSELHVVNQAGESRGFITGEVSIGSPQWHPQSNAIYYVARRNNDKTPSLYKIPIDGGESQQVLSFSTGVGAFAISSDGTRVAFLAKEETPTNDSDTRAKGFNQEVYEENWKPTKVWIAPLDGSTAPRDLDIPGSVSAVDWHPTRPELAVVVAPTSLVDDSYMSKRVRVVNADTGQITEKIENPGKLGQIGWSPDGTHLALLSAADIHDPEEGRLMVVQIPGDGQLRELHPNFTGHFNSFAWADNNTLLWTAAESTETTVGSVSLDGRIATLISQPGTILAGISVSDDGKSLGLLGNTSHHPQEVYRWHSDGELTRQTNVNPWLSEMAFAKQETFKWKARDGVDLEGILIYPLDYVEGRQYPLIMLVHGGPESHVPNGWVTTYSQPGQIGAARGFAVFYPNYRGSTGRGVEFSKLGQADAAGKEFDDLIDGIDRLAEIGLVDQTKVGITGGSYGGYASAWGATYYSDRFAASVMFVGISDAISKMGTTDIPEEMFLVHHLKRLWDDWEYFYERSPIRYVQRNKTPTLILHGKEDPRVHPSQSLELYRHLKTLDQAPVRLVLYEGEGHGNRKAAARLDYNLRLMRWMEHYLIGPGGNAPDVEIDYEAALK
jgi:dipeptidyl aminopeptidase/acylaminoacyl peptidase